MDPIKEEPFFDCLESAADEENSTRADANGAVGSPHGQSFYNPGGALPPSQEDPAAWAKGEAERRKNDIGAGAVEKTNEEKGGDQCGASSSAKSDAGSEASLGSWEDAAAIAQKNATEGNAKLKAAEDQDDQDAADGEEEKKKADGTGSNKWRWNPNNWYYNGQWKGGWWSWDEKEGWVWNEAKWDSSKWDSSKWQGDH